MTSSVTFSPRQPGVVAVYIKALRKSPIALMTKQGLESFDIDPAFAVSPLLLKEQRFKAMAQAIENIAPASYLELKAKLVAALIPFVPT